MRLNIKNLQNFSIFILIIILSFLTNNTYATIVIFGWLNILLFIMYLLETKKTHKLFSIYILFLCFTFLFHFGQVFMYSIGLKESIEKSIISANVIFDNSIETVVSSIKFSTLVIFVFNMGAQSVFIKNRNISSKIYFSSVQRELKISRFTGLIILAVSLYFVAKFDLAYIRHALTSGYGGIHNLDVNYGITDDMARLFKVGMIFLIIGFKENKLVSQSLILLNLLYSIFKIIMTGLRGYETIYIIILIWIYFKLFSKLTKFKMIIICLSGILFLSISSLAVLVRDGITKIELSSIFKFALYRNPIVSSINEFGSTLISVQLFMDYVPKVIDYGLGGSYILSMITLLPNIGGWLNDITYLAYPNAILAGYNGGIGGSFIGELYYNFGYMGIFFVFIIGCLIGKISDVAEKSINNNNFFIFGIITSNLNTLFWIIRDSFSILPRNFMFAIAIPLVLLLYLKRNKVKIIHNKKCKYKSNLVNKEKN